MYRVVYFEDGRKKRVELGGRREDIVAKLKSEGKVVVSVKESVRSVLTRRKIQQKETMAVLSAMAELLKSGVPMSVGLDTVVASLAGKKSVELRNVMARVADSVRDGRELSVAMEDYPDVFGPTTLSMVRAGEQSGKLADAMDNSAKYLNNVASMKKEAVSQLRYPVIILLVAICAMLINSIYTIPKIMDSPLFQMATADGKEMDGQWATDALRNLSWILPSAIGVLVLTVFVMVGIYKIRQKEMEKIFFRIGYVRAFIFYRNFYLAFYSMSKLLESGVRQDHALRIVHDSLAIYTLKQEFKNALAKLQAGEPFFSAFKFLDPVEEAMLEMAPSAERIHENLMLVSNRFYNQYIAKVKSLAPKVYAFTMLFVAGLFILMLLGIMLPYSQILSGVM